MKAYVIECRTGCSCCASENHYRGPYSSQNVALEKVAHFHNTKLLASQYARSGVYTIEEKDAELLPDGRIIVNNTVFPGFKDSGEDDYIEVNWW